MIVYTNRHIPTAYAASSSAVGFGADNAGMASIVRAWRAASAGAAEHLTVDLGASRTLGAVLLTGVNATGMRVLADNTAAPITERIASLASFAEPHGRRKALGLLGGISARYLRIAFPAATITDTLGAWQIGAIYLFAPAAPVAQALLGSARTLHRPRVQETLPNGQLASADTGQAWTELSLEFRATRDLDPASLEAAADAGIIAVDMELGSRRDLVWPMRSLATEHRSTFARVRQDEAPLALREVV